MGTEGDIVWTTEDLYLANFMSPTRTGAVRISFVAPPGEPQFIDIPVTQLGSESSVVRPACRDVTAAEETNDHALPSDLKCGTRFVGSCRTLPSR